MAHHLSFARPFILFAILGIIGIFAQETAYLPGELNIQISPEAAPFFTVRMENGVALTGVAELDALNRAFAVTTITPLLRFPPKNEALADRYGLNRSYVFKMSPAADIPRLAQAYQALPGVVYAEPNFVVQAVQAPSRKASISGIELTPDDPLYPAQWAHHNTGQAIPFGGGGPVGTPGVDIDTDLAWDLHTGDNSVILSIIDTGVDYNHPEFAGRIVAGYDFVNNDNDPMDDNGHGTSCAGIAAAAGNNGIGVAGVNWGCRIMPVKVLDAGGGGSNAGVAGGIIFAADNGSRVLSLSLGSNSASAALENAVNYAYGLDCVIMAARGNANNPVAHYPASYANAIAVGAISPCDERKSPSSCDGENWWGSSYGDDLDFMAPGTRIHTTDITGAGGYSSGDYTATFNGTSAATPFAAGAAALLRSYSPGLTNAQVRQRMRDTAIDMGTPGFDNQTGYGRINAYHALTGTISVPDIDVSPASLSFIVPVDGNDAAILTIQNTGDYPLNWSISEQDVMLALDDGRRLPVQHLPMWPKTLDSENRAESLLGSLGDASGNFEGSFSAQYPVSGYASAVAGPVGPFAPEATVSLVLDDGSREAAVGLTNGGQFIWLNRFTPNPADFPFTLEEIHILFPAAAGVSVGQLVDIYIYEDTDGDGDPGTGANFLAAYNNAAVQAVDNVTFSVYSIAPLVLDGPNDVLIAVVNRTAGIAAGTYVAAIDQTASAGRSWLGTYITGNPGDPPTLPANSLWGTIDSFGISGNWMIRGYGVPGDGCPWLSENPLNGTIPGGGSQQVTISVDATGLTPGVYFCSLLISSNDPDENPVTVRVKLTVTNGLVVNAKVWLEGPYQGGSMDTYLRDNGLLPVAQPFNMPPWNYGGAESVAGIPAGVVDWVLLQLKEVAGGDVLASRAAFVKNNGIIVDMDGSSPVDFLYPPGNYYLVVRQRNHLAIMSANPLALDESSALYNFTTAQAQAYGTDPMKQLEIRVYGMIAGDGNSDGSVNLTDRENIWRPQNGAVWDYLKFGDYNLDGGIDARDLNFYWRPDSGSVTQVP